MREQDGERPLTRRYANRLEVVFAPGEFVLDFGQEFDGVARLHSGIVATPRVVEAFVEALQQSLGEYRRRHGADEGRHS